MAETTLTLAEDTPTGGEAGSILFIGTATTLVRCGGFTLLTDPNFLHAGEHAHLGYGLRSRRQTDPAVEIDALPPLDACVLSHFHGDAWDEVATANLPKELPVLTTPHAARALRQRGFSRARELVTWDSVRLRRGRSWLRVTSLPGRHGPRPVSALLPPVMGSMLEFGTGQAGAAFRVYVSGDTLLHQDLLLIPERYPQVDVGLFHLGGARIAGVLLSMDAEQGVEAVRIIGPEVSIPIHYDDYPVFKSPLDEFVRAVVREGLARRVHFLAHGERYEFTVPVLAEPVTAEGPVRPITELRPAHPGS
jgi:L-ascorbate metabolism protein UlaG (beta-lactamase superfamily)